MSQKGTISISFKLEGDENGFKKLTMDAESLRKALNATVVESEKLKGSVVNFAALATGIDSMSRSISDLQNAIKGLSDAHAAQMEVETKLAVNMRNTMGAREEDIQSIKDFCAAQQQIGVVGDEVQLAGAQEMATYLEEKQSLEKLIPVMNDMLVQQYGLNFSQENAAQIATMLGKVMQGQTGALSRYGYTFDSAQEKILKFGTEAQRAAVLCDVVSSSVGGMNEEFAKTDDGKLKQMDNTIGDLKESLGGLVKSAMPFLTIAANATIALGGIWKLTAGVKSLVAVCVTGTKSLKTFWLATATISSGTTGLTKSVATCRLFISQFCTAVTQGTKGLRLFATAWRGMLISTGIGIAIAAVTAIIAYFALKTDEATESTNKFLSSEERAKQNAEQLEQLRKQEASTLTNTRAALEINISKLKEFNGTKEQEKKVVDEMNDTYGDTMGYFSSVAEWYKALTENSKAYCQQMVIEARTRMLANQIAEKEQEIHDIRYDDSGKLKKYSTQRDVEQVQVGTYVSTTGGAGGAPQPIYETREIAGTSDLDKANAAIKDNVTAVAHLREQMNNAAKEAAGISFGVKGTPTRPGATGSHGGSHTEQTEKTRIQEINEEITKLKEKYITASETEREEIRKNIQALDTEKQSIEKLYREAERPLTLNTLDDIDKEISYQKSLRTKATKENIAGIDTEIKRLEELRNGIESASHTPMPIEEIKTYEQLNGELAYFNRLLEKADETQRASIQEEINKRNDLKKAWDKQLDDLKKPAEISALDSIEKLDEAISYYQARQKEATGDEIQNIQKTIDAHERKRVALQRGIEIPSMQREVDEINKLTGKDYKVKIQGMGFDELTSKIKELQRMLDDVENPLTDSQREDIQGLISSYEKWRKEGVMTFDTMRDGWGSLKGIGDGVQSLTETLKGNGDAWQKITSIVDGFLQIYDGIKTIVGIIEMLTMVTGSHTSAKTAEAVAVGTATGAQAAEAITSEANAAAQAPVIAANKLATASYMELAAAAYFAAHATIPFAGFGIATGFISASKFIVEAIGATPFAEGGIVSGPTLGLVGEYAGARNNPEVIAPLDKLRSIIEPADSGVGKVTFKIDGRTLVGILEKETNLKHRS